MTVDQGDVTIRQVTAEAAEAWRAIRLEALETTPDAFAAKLKDWRDRPLAEFAAQLADNPTFLAFERGAAVGCITWTRDGELPVRGWIEGVFVVARARGRNLAQRLIAAAIADARKAGMTEMWLEVGARNAAAQGAYHRAGFRAVTGPDRPSPSCGACDVSMRRDLD